MLNRFIRVPMTARGITNRHQQTDYHVIVSIDVGMQRALIITPRDTDPNLLLRGFTSLMRILKFPRTASPTAPVLFAAEKLCACQIRIVASTCRIYLTGRDWHSSNIEAVMALLMRQLNNLAWYHISQHQWTEASAVGTVSEHLLDHIEFAEDHLARRTTLRRGHARR